MIEVAVIKDPAAMSGGDLVVVAAFGTPKVWDTSSRAAALPLIEIQRLAYSLILPRVFTQGRSDTGGSFSPPYSTKKTRYWVDKHRPQPPGFVERSVRYPGRVRYESASHYRRALGMTTPRFVESGRLARSFKIKALGPRKVRITATGGRPGERRGSSTNAKLLQNLVRGRYKNSVIKPSRRELQKLTKLTMEIYPAQLLNKAIRQEMAFNARKRFARRQRALEQILKRQRAAQRQVQAQGRK